MTMDTTDYPVNQALVDTMHELNRLELALLNFDLKTNHIFRAPTNQATEDIIKTITKEVGKLMLAIQLARLQIEAAHKA